MRISPLILLFFLLACSSFAFAEDPPISDRIVGGNNATPGEYPFMAGLFIKGASLENGQFCGGSLIHPKWVLTAAHCLESLSAAQVQVGLALHDLRFDSGEVIDVQRIILHPSYNSSTNDSDIALIELTTPSTQGTPISIVSDAQNLTGLTSTAIGWGLTTEGGSPSPILQEVDLPVVSNLQCNTYYGGGITDNMVCAGFAAGGKDACQGDSGGPLIIGGSSAPVLIGATSFGVGCARPNFPGVWTRVSKFSSWIAGYVTTASETDGPYGLWNGFLGMFNIVELMNRGSSDVQAQINMYDIAGTLISSTNILVEAGKQRDVVLNQLSGFSANSYGVVRVSSNVEGRIFYYKLVGGTFDDFQFVFGLQLTDPISGPSYVGFNTYQPSRNIFEAGNLVANWLSVVNLSDTVKNFTVNKYAMDGSLLSTSGFSLNPKNRIDLDGGHINPGPSQVGLLEILPADGSTEYLAQLVRYGYNADGTTFSFAFPLVATAGFTNQIAVPLGSQFGAQDWLEVVNTGSSSNNITARIYDSGGTLRSQQVLSLAAKSQIHLDITSILGSNVEGHAELDTGSAGTITQSMFYFYNPQDNTITTMYGSQAGVATASVVNGSFNLFLGMENYLRIANTSNTTINIGLTISSIFSGGSSGSQTIGPNASVSLPLHDGATYGTVPNSYGIVTVSPPSGGALVTEVVRVKREPSGVLQFAAPTGLL